MESSTVLQYLYICLYSPLSERVFGKLLKNHGSLSSIRESANDGKFNPALKAKTGFLKDIDQLVMSSKTHLPIQKAINWENSSNNHIICYESDDYPPLLKEIDDPPPLLYVVGKKALLKLPQLAIVGSRKASSYGKSTAYHLSRELSRFGLVLNSGMATGIDSQCHLGCLDHEGLTLAVLGTGVDLCYPPRNQELMKRIADRGALVSEYPLGTTPSPPNFPKRNRIISGLSEGVIVVEAALRSGSLITCRLAMEQNREVFAVPGLVTSAQSKGCHQLINEGAILVQSAEQIISELNLSGLVMPEEDYNCSKSVKGSMNEDETKIVELLQSSPATLDQLIHMTQRDVAKLSSILISLETNKVIRCDGLRYSLN